MMIMLQQGSLWQSILGATERARAAGSLVPIPTKAAFIDDGGVRFAVRVLAGLRRKAEARREQEAAERDGRQANPFLPPEKDLFVADITGTHLAVLNKFNVVDHHLLIVTRVFEDQELLLTPADLEALWLCMAEFDGLGFYNGGTAGGASQRHRHLQMVPLPLSPHGHAVPMVPLFAAAESGPDGMGAVPAFPFRHVFCRIDPELWRLPLDAAQTTFGLYARMLERAGMEPPAGSGPTRQSLPYCLLVSREWMLLVPRSKEHIAGISFNSLAYAGSLFVPSEDLLAGLRAYGPLNALRDAAFPP